MRNKPGNFILLLLACCVLADFLLAKPNNEGMILVSVGVFGALLSRALLTEPQSVMVCFLGLGLTVLVICGNSGLIGALSGGWYFSSLLIAFTYALWEKIYNWIKL
jgi:uncharacterized membrane protein YeaQ/YmgE (transglycosylase-associated protein family)